MKKILLLLLGGMVSIFPLGCGKEEVLEPTLTPPDQEYVVNLNDNIEVYYNRYSTLCGGWMFITNLEDYVTAGMIKQDGYTEIQVGGSDIAPHEWEEYMTHFTYDSDKENMAKSEFNQIDGNLYGIGNYVSSFDQHKFYYEYNTIEVVDEASYPEFASRLNETRQSFENQMLDIFAKNGAYLYTGPCGEAYGERQVLTDEMCDMFHISCDRW